MNEIPRIYVVPKQAFLIIEKTVRVYYPSLACLHLNYI